MEVESVTKYGRKVTAIELHSFNPFDFSFKALAFVDSDNTVFADLFHRVRKKLADFFVVVRGDRSNVGHFFFVFDLDRHLRQFFQSQC